MRISILLFVGLLLGVAILKAQPTQMLLPLQKTIARKCILQEPKNSFLLSIPDSAKRTSPNNYLPVNFYSEHTGIMCKMELKMEKGIKLPLRIRLGSKDQVDYLEGKYRKH